MRPSASSILTWIALLAFTAGGASTQDGTADTPPGLAELDRSMRDVVARVGPSVVNVIAFYPAQGQAEGGRQEARSFSSTGLVFGGGRYVLAPAGPIRAGAQIYLEGAFADGRSRSLRATVVGCDTDLNLAVLQLVVDARLTPATIGDPRALEPGAFVMSFSRHYRRPVMTRFGLVTGLGHEIVVGERTMHGMITASVPIDEDDVGAALADARGCVVGIVLSAEPPDATSDTASAGPAPAMERASATPFTLPIDRALASAREIIAGRDPAARRAAPRRFLGVRGSYLRKPNAISAQLNLPAGRGFVVEQVFEREAADRAGVKEFDVLLSLGGFPVEGSEYSLAIALDKLPNGRPVELVVLRSGVKIAMKIEFGTPAKATKSDSGATRGANAKD